MNLLRNFSFKEFLFKTLIVIKYSYKVQHEHMIKKQKQKQKQKQRYKCDFQCFKTFPDEYEDAHMMKEMLHWRKKEVSGF